MFKIMEEKRYKKRLRYDLKKIVTSETCINAINGNSFLCKVEANKEKEHVVLILLHVPYKYEVDRLRRWLV